MQFEVSVVVRRGNEWMLGKILGFKFTPYKKIKKLSDVDNMAAYKSARDFMVEHGKHPKLAFILEKETGLDRIYILDKPTYCSSEEAEEHFWKSGLNEKCQECQKDCKQSSLVSIHHCPDFQGV